MGESSPLIHYFFCHPSFTRPALPATSVLEAIGSNFARSGSHPRAVAISRTQPRGWTGRAYEPLAPSWRLVLAAKSGAIDEGEYTRRNRAEVLASLDPAEVHADLGEDTILLCWERSGAFCHRRPVAELLEERLEVLVPEVGEVGGEGDRGQTRLEGFIRR